MESVRDGADPMLVSHPMGAFVYAVNPHPAISVPVHLSMPDQALPLACRVSHESGFDSTHVKSNRPVAISSVLLAFPVRSAKRPISGRSTAVACAHGYKDNTR